MEKMCWVLGGFLAVLFYPQKPVLIDFRGYTPQILSIGVDRMSPAFAALEDTKNLVFTRDLASIKFEPDQKEEFVLLGSGTPFSHPELLGEESSGRAEPQPESRLEENRWLPLAGLTITSKSHPSEKIGQDIVASNSSSRGKSRQLKLPPADSPEWIGLPLAQRRELLVEKFGNESINWPSFTERLAAAAEREFGPRVGSGPAPGPGLGTTPPSTSGRNIASGRPESINRTEDEGLDLPGFMPASAALEIASPTEIVGRVRMQGGIAYMGEKTQVKVFRENRGRPLESGPVELPTGEFKIEVASLSGELVAELQTREGEVLGRGELELGLLASPANPVEIVLLPVEEGLRVSALSAHSYGLNKLNVAGARAFVDALDMELRANEEGVFFDQLHGVESSYIVRLEAPDHWTSLAVGTASIRQDVRLFPNSMMEALFSLTADVYAWDLELLRSRAVIWGRVSEGGKPKAGAKVELAESAQAEVIYLNQHFLPDHRLETTSQNGLFVVLMVDPGIHSLRATVGKRSLPTVVLPAEVGSVSYLEMEAGPNRKASVKLSRPFSGQQDRPLPGTISLLGSEHVLDIESEEQIVYPSAPGQMMVEGDAGSDFEITRVTVSRQSREIDLPMIPRQWLLDISAQKRVSYDLSSGVVVGFVEGDDFTVYLEDGFEYPDHHIIYFDQQGGVIDGGKGISGGGFALFNLPFGARTVTVLPKNQSSIFTQVLVPEARVVNVINHNFKSGL